MICSRLATINGEEEEMCLMINDVKSAYFYAPVKRPIYIELPDEDRTEEDEALDNIAVLNFSMYGTRDAAQNWSDKVSAHLKEIGYKKGQ